MNRPLAFWEPQPRIVEYEILVALDDQRLLPLGGAMEADRRHWRFDDHFVAGQMVVIHSVARGAGPRADEKRFARRVEGDIDVGLPEVGRPRAVKGKRLVEWR